MAHGPSSKKKKLRTARNKNRAVEREINKLAKAHGGPKLFYSKLAIALDVGSQTADAATSIAWAQQKLLGAGLSPAAASAAVGVALKTLKAAFEQSHAERSSISQNQASPVV